MKGRGRSRYLWHLLLAIPALIAGGACGGTRPAAATHRVAPVPTLAAFSCTDPQAISTVQGNPHLASVPSLEFVSLAPRSGGLLVTVKFRRPLVLAPEGVYIAWTVYVYRHRSDAASFESEVELEFQDRGKGFEPSGWTMVASTYTHQTPVAGDVHTDNKRDELSVFFPAGFVDLSPPFYWFASQEEFRAYLPKPDTAAPQDWSINGAVFTDCPADVRPDPNSAPYAAKLLTVVT
jgi:hypothetical protein